ALAAASTASPESANWTATASTSRSSPAPYVPTEARQKSTRSAAESGGTVNRTAARLRSGTVSPPARTTGPATDSARRAVHRGASAGSSSRRSMSSAAEPSAASRSQSRASASRSDDVPGTSAACSTYPTSPSSSHAPPITSRADDESQSQSCTGDQDAWACWFVHNSASRPANARRDDDSPAGASTRPTSPSSLSSRQATAPRP